MSPESADYQDSNESHYSSGSQPVVPGPPVVHSHLPGSPQARPNIYPILRKRYAKREMFQLSNFFHLSHKKNNSFCV